MNNLAWFNELPPLAYAAIKAGVDALDRARHAEIEASALERYRPATAQDIADEAEKKWLPLDDRDFPPGTVVRSPWMQETTRANLWSAVLRVFGDSIHTVDWDAKIVCVTFDELAEGWQIRRPGEDWQPCRKIDPTTRKA